MATLTTSGWARGAISFTFNSTHAPANGQAITVSYIQNGWGIGTGLLDEDGRTSHLTWLGRDILSLSDTHSNTKTDLNNFLKSVADHYFKSCHDGIKGAFPNTMYMGPVTLSTWSVPSRDVVLQAASPYMDLMLTAGQAPFTQAMIDYVYANFGDKPYIEGEYRTANPDSALSAYSDTNVGSFGTQANRGQSYYNDVASLQNQAITTNGSHPYIGATWWQFIDNWGEKLNWGLVTTLDNVYDENEARGGPYVDFLGYARGGEQADYGDMLTPLKQANNQWINTH